MNINELFTAAQDAPDDGYSDLLGPTDLEGGTSVQAEIVYSKGEVKNDAPRWTNKLKVIGDHPAAGGEFFDSVFTSSKPSDGAKSYNKRQFAKLQSAGLDADFFASAPSVEAIATALKGSIVTVNIKWQEPNEKGQVWGEHTWSPAEGAIDGPVGFGTPAGY